MKTYEELLELLQFDEEKESKIFLPNEIFEDLLNENRIKSISHRAFAYSYIYLVTWLYRYCKYSETTETIDQRKLKDILGLHPEGKSVNYLISKNGLLEQLGYLKTTTNYPVSWIFEDGNYDNDDNLIGVTFETYNDLKDSSFMHENLNMGRNFNIKYPIKAFHRNGNEEELDGTFYNFESTFLVPFEVFLYCMSNEEVGTMGFYLWSYLKMKSQIFVNGYDASIERLERETGLKNRTVVKYISILKKYRMVKFWHNQDFFAPNLEKEKRKSNTYLANDYDLFSDKPVTYEKIKFVTEDEYNKIKDNKGNKELETLLSVSHI